MRVVPLRPVVALEKMHESIKNRSAGILTFVDITTAQTSANRLSVGNSPKKKRISQICHVVEYTYSHHVL